MSKELDRLLAAETLWAISREGLERIKAAASGLLAGQMDIEGLQAQLVTRRGSSGGFERDGKVAILRLEGVLTRQLNLFSLLFGGTSTEAVERDLKAALESPEIEGILLLVNSPGGTVDGAPELAQTIFSARGKKPVVALADSTAASAALWIAAAADSLLLRGPTSVVGSIGVVAVHFDFSRREESAGIKVSEIVSAPRKNLVSPHQPLTEEGREALQRQVDFVHEQFVSDLARNRGVGRERAAQWGTGEVFFAEEAMRLGLADGFATPESVVAQLAGGSALGGGKSSVSPPKAASAPGPGMVATAPKPSVESLRKLAGPEFCNWLDGQPAAPPTEALAPPERSAGAADPNLAFTERCKAEWQRNLGGVREEFGSLESYTAFKKAEAAGKVRIVGASRNEIEVEEGKMGKKLGTFERQEVAREAEKQARQEWERDAAVRVQFGSVERYVAFRRAQATGQAHIPRDAA